MPMHITYTTRGLSRLESAFIAAGRRTDEDGMRLVFEAIAKKMMRSERMLFETSGASAGRPWRVLDKSTIKTKAREGQSPRPLVATGLLKASLSEKGAPYQILHITDNTLELGTNRPAAVYHHVGAGHNPQRPIIMFTIGQIGTFYDDLQSWIFEGVIR